jgi:hypothetical protein
MTTRTVILKQMRELQTDNSNKPQHAPIQTSSKSQEPVKHKQAASQAAYTTAITKQHMPAKSASIAKKATSDSGNSKPLSKLCSSDAHLGLARKAVISSNEMSKMSRTERERVMRNRLSARRSKEAKKEFYTNLVTSVKGLRAEHRGLQANITQAQQQLAQLLQQNKDLMMACGCEQCSKDMQEH